MAASAFDPFEVLGLRPGATPDQIRAAYREQVARFHPDKHRGNPLEELAAAKLVDINRAYEILSKGPAPGSGTAVPRRGSAPAAPERGPTPAATLFKSLGMLAGLVFFLRFGMTLSREIFAILRGLLMSVLWVFRLGPVFAVTAVVAIALGMSYFIRSRRGSD